jgi:aminopeptidase N
MDFMWNKRTALWFTCALSLGQANAQVSAVGSISRSDSIDILHTGVALDLTNSSNGIIRGDVEIRFTPRVGNITTLPLDLLLPVDSVVMNGSMLGFTHPGEVLAIGLPGSYGPGDTLSLTVIYHGNPPTDPSGFGGFYTLSTYQYDLGVAFDAVPHSYGRAWFPCFDNFVERCTFDYWVHTTGGRSVFANGVLQGITDLGNGERITHWQLAEPIPSYLASVAAGNYATITDSFPSVTGAQVPVLLAALPGDTAHVRSSFAHLKDAFHTFEHWFGPYRWNRVGYVLTSAGAMEHATNICYPDFAADGTLGNEDLIAHELSHHWFGDLITCARPEEMYLNEGFADFCAKLHMEALYGPDVYKALVRTNHHQVVAAAHLQDGGWYALANVPQNVTYGETSYKKGSDIARTLRAVMGDSLFSAGFKRLFSNNAYTPMASAAVRDSLSAATGLDLTDFFNNWIFQPGGAAFMVDSFSVVQQGGLFATTVHIHQKTRGGAALFQHVPVSLTCINAAGAEFQTLVELSDEFSTIVVQAPFLPVTVRLNNDERLALSSTVDTATITATGQLNLPNADLWLSTTSFSAPAKVRIEEYWVPADPALDNSFFISPDRWWRVEAELPPGTAMKFRFTVDGREGVATAFDRGLMQDAGGTAIVEDSLVVLHRTSPAAAWMPVPATIAFLGSHTDKFARIDMTGVESGDYAIGWRMHPTSIIRQGAEHSGWRFFPDPASEQITVVAPPTFARETATLLVHDLSGRLLDSLLLRSPTTPYDISGINAQTVILSVRFSNHKQIALGSLHIVH